VNIVFHANLPPVTMCEYPLYCKFSTGGNALKPHVSKFTALLLHFCNACINNKTVGIVRIPRETIIGD
jgi:hypothetical protein